MFRDSQGPGKLMPPNVNERHQENTSHGVKKLFILHKITKATQ
jgi:hypothetical protein